jgi:hypothetical protein
MTQLPPFPQASSPINSIYTKKQHPYTEPPTQQLATSAQSARDPKPFTPSENHLRRKMATELLQRQLHLRNTSPSKGQDLEDRANIVVEGIDVAMLLHDGTDPTDIVDLIAPNMRLLYELPVEKVGFPGVPVKSFKGNRLYIDNPLFASTHGAARETLQNATDIVWLQSDLFGRNRQAFSQVMDEMSGSFWDEINSAASGEAQSVDSFQDEFSRTLQTLDRWNGDVELESACHVDSNLNTG